MSSLALGTVVFMRTGRLEQLLASIPSPVEKVYVADNGEITPERRRVYDRDYTFELEVLDLEYDSGLGHGRNEIVKRLTEDYLLVVDCDMTIPNEISVLSDQLDAQPHIGGVSGVLLERGNLTGASCDIYEEGDLLIKDIRSTKDAEFVSESPFVEFDFVPNAAMFRSECLEEYAWDPTYRFGSEHLDFYVAHKRQTDWKFGTCPSVVFPHFPGGDDKYMAARTGDGDRKSERSRQYFLNKWGYHRVLPIQGRWIESFSDTRLRSWRFLASYGARMAFRRLPTQAKVATMNLRDRLEFS